MNLLVNQLRANSTKVGPEPVFVSPWAIWRLPNKGTMSDMEKRLTYWEINLIDGSLAPNFIPVTYNQRFMKVIVSP